MSKETERVFAARIKAALDDDLTRIDARIVGRLRAARRTALADKPPRARLGFTWWAQAGVAAGIASVALLMLWPQPEPTTPLMASNVEDTEVLFQSADGLELYRNLDFYRWLATNDRRG